MRHPQSSFAQKSLRSLTIGIDATNLRRGGGVTHLVELLQAAEPGEHGIKKIIIWGGRETLSGIEPRPWLRIIQPVEIDRGLVQRTFWQRYKLSRAARDEGCHLLFVPGGSYTGDFKPVVTMNRNLLPFEMRELLRFGWSLTTLRFLLLRWIQSRSLRAADGVIFLTEYARDRVIQVTGHLSAAVSVIHHGRNDQFRMAPRDQHPIREYSLDKPYRLLYVSIINQYKHQWHVVEAVSQLRRDGWPVVLDLVGPADPSALMRLKKSITRLDLESLWVHYHGAQPYSELHRIYAQADLGVFASSCETFGQIVTEMMSAGLPIACSSRSAMPELLGDAAVYFDPENPADIARAIHELIESPGLRAEKAQLAYIKSQQFSWQCCASETLTFLAGIAHSMSEVSHSRACPDNAS